MTREDVKAEAYCRALTGYDPEKGPFEARLFYKLRHLRKDVIRKESRFDRNVDISTVPCGCVQFQRAFRRERRKIVKSIIGKMDRRSRLMIMMSFYGGMTEDEIAEKMKVSKSTVSRTIKDALNRIRDLLAWYGYKKEDLLEDIKEENLPKPKYHDQSEQSKQ